MNKVLVAVFNTESAAFEGLSALKDLHRDGDISLYATSIVTKDATGAVKEKQVVDEGPIGTTIGLLTGSLVGLLAGPVGLAVGASLGGLMGVLFDLDKSGIDLRFVNDVEKALSPGKVAVLADMDETWTTPVDTRMAKLGGIVFRRYRAEVVEDQMAREAAAFDAEMKHLKDELKDASVETRTAIRKEMDAVKKKLQDTQDQVKAKLDQAKNETEAKIAAMQEQLKQASDRQKAKIEKRMAAVKADYEARKAKLGQANGLIKEALTV